jgi:hypothetical protein
MNCDACLRLNCTIDDGYAWPPCSQAPDLVDAGLADGAIIMDDAAGIDEPDGQPYAKWRVALEGNAGDGPGAGESNYDLCKAVYACAERTQCGKSDLSSCYCGSVSGANCLSPGTANGPCKSDIESGLETTDPASIAQQLTNPDLPGGAALSLMACAFDNCFNECYVDPAAAPTTDAGSADQ